MVLAIGASQARAAISCSLDAGTGKLLVNWNNSGDRAFLARSGMTIEVRGGSTATSPLLACAGGPLSTSTVTGIVASVNAGGILGSITGLRGSLSLAGGLMPPTTFFGVQRVELIGQPGDDVIRIGADGVDFGNDGTADVFLSLVSDLRVFGAPAIEDSGRDTIVALGSAATGGASGLDRPLLLSGGAGDDTLVGALADDLLEPGPGDDIVGGGTNFVNGDTVSYEDLPGSLGVQLDLSLQLPLPMLQPASAGGRDTLSGIENLIGSPSADSLIGDDGSNTLNAGPDAAGRSGTDVLSGLGGDDALLDSRAADALDGGFGEDTLRVQNGGDDSADGGPDRDSILAGEGTLGGPPGTDLLDGGQDIDTLSYVCSGGGSSGVTVDLAVTGAQATGASGTDTLNGFENLEGSDGPDVLKGDDLPNAIFGVGLPPCNGTESPDRIEGRGGNDLLGAQLSFPELNANAMIIDGGTGDDRLTGTSLGDHLTGGYGNDILDALSGNDILDSIDAGGADQDRCGQGIDRVGYDEADALTECEQVGLNIPPPPPGTPLGLGERDPFGADELAAAVARNGAGDPGQLPRLPASAGIALPAAKACLSRRRLTVTLKTPPGAQLARAVVTVGGKTLADFRPARATTPVNLSGLPRGRFTVRVTVTLKDGRVLRQSRRYRTCTKKRSRTRVVKRRATR